MKDVIVSPNNQNIIKYSSLKEKKYREINNLFLVNGRKLTEELIKNNIGLLKVIFCTEANYDYCRNMVEDNLIYTVSDRVIDKLSSEKAPDGVIAVADYDKKLHTISQCYTPLNNERIFIAEGIRDPGNLGTLIRSSSAFGIDCLILSGDCADIYNPKTVRGSMGALFRQKISIVNDMCKTVDLLKTGGYNIYAAMLDKNAIPLNHLTVTGKTAFIVGNEGHGISPELCHTVKNSVYIPMESTTESLNAAAAANILLWEMYRGIDKNN